MKIYNNLIKEIEDFQTIRPKEITMYVCGPTVYGDIHLGNARSIITFDIIHRYFLSLDYQVNFLHNITDIDDKIIAKSLEQNVSELNLSNKYFNEYLDILDKLNIKKPTQIVKVSENMDAITSFIQNLISLGDAYQTDEGIYFDTSKVSNYANILAKQNIDQLKQSNKNQSKNKKNVLDFALWKFTKSGICWEFPKGHNGRPGWHTECVALINRYLGPLIDIHGGGVDLVFPHHENEIAQQIAFAKSNLANYWIHNGHLHFNENKMSKSLNNTIIVKDFLNYYSSNAIRYLFCMSGYRSILNLNSDMLHQAAREEAKIKNIVYTYKTIWSMDENNNYDQDTINEFNKEMGNNFNFANVLTIISKIIKKIPTIETNHQDLNKYVNSLFYILKTLGFKY